MFLYDAFVPLRRIQSFLEDVPSRISVFFTIFIISLTLPCGHPLASKRVFCYSIALIETKRLGLVTHMNGFWGEAKKSGIFPLYLFYFVSKGGNITLC